MRTGREGLDNNEEVIKRIVATKVINKLHYVSSSYNVNDQMHKRL